MKFWIGIIPNPLDPGNQLVKTWLPWIYPTSPFVQIWHKVILMLGSRIHWDKNAWSSQHFLVGCGRQPPTDKLRLARKENRESSNQLDIANPVRTALEPWVCLVSMYEVMYLSIYLSMSLQILLWIYYVFISLSLSLSHSLSLSLSIYVQIYIFLVCMY